jgi:hypothetical protein
MICLNMKKCKAAPNKSFNRAAEPPHGLGFSPAAHARRQVTGGVRGFVDLNLRLPLQARWHSKNLDNCLEC